MKILFDKRRRRQRVALTAVAVGVAVLASSIVYVYQQPPPPKSLVLNAVPKQPSLLGGYSDTPAQARGPSVVLREPASKLPPPPAGPGPGDAKFVVLAQGATYAERTEARKMAQSCLMEKVTRVRIASNPCELSPERYNDVETRKRLVEECALKGDCYTEFHNYERPEGIFAAFDSDPQRWAAIEQQVRERSLAKGDYLANASESHSLAYATQKMTDPGAVHAALSESLSREVVSAINTGAIAGITYDERSIRRNHQLEISMQRYAQLSDPEVNNAIAKGLQMAATAKQEKAKP